MSIKGMRKTFRYKKHHHIPKTNQRNGALSYTHTKFRISKFAAEIIKMKQFTPQAAKLLFALIFLQDQTHDSWPNKIDLNHKLEAHFVFAQQLRELCFQGRTGSSRFLRRPTAELSNVIGIFDHIQISDNGRYLKWKFSENFFDIMSDMEIYGLIDANEISLCQRKFDGALLAQIALNRKKRLPEFSLIAPNRDYERTSKAKIKTFLPNEMKRQLYPSLQNWANNMAITFAVLFTQDGENPGYTNVLIRMKHETTHWAVGRFTKRPPSAILWTVEPNCLLASADGADAMHGPI
jgi:hypothetical protein